MRAQTTYRVMKATLALFVAGMAVATLFVAALRVQEAFAAPEKATVTLRYHKASIHGQWLDRQELKRAVRVLRAENKRLRVRHARDLTYYLRLGADLFHVDRGLLASVIYCESHNYQYAKNRSSTASGYGQWLDSTWASSGLRNFSVFDGLANVLATARLISDGGLSHWNASRGCWG